jgi:hypothetical protein
MEQQNFRRSGGSLVTVNLMKVQLNTLQMNIKLINNLVTELN